MTKIQLDELSSDMQRKVKIILTLTNFEKPNLENLEKETGLSKPSVMRHLKSLRTDFGMQISYIRDNASSGYYKINDWGIIEFASFSEYFANC